jgi:hypothetical protein
MVMVGLFCAHTSAIAETINVALHWQDNSDNEEHFVVEHHTANETFTQIGETDENATSYTAQLDNSVTNYYRVYAKNSGGNSDYSNVALFTIKGDVDGSGSVNLSDAILGLQIVDNITVQNDIHLESDVNDDNRIGLPESVHVLQQVAE